MDSMTNNNLMTTRDVADLLGVGVSSVKRWTEQGDLPCVRTAGGHRRFESATVDRFRREQLEQSEETRPYPAGMLNIDGYRLPAPLHEMTAAELDALPFGVIQLDDEGRVLLYNKGESKISGISAERVLGRPFFTEVAPCTNNRLVRGRFEEGVAMKDLDCSIDYTFTYKMRPTSVRIRLRRDGPSRTNWLLITPRDGK
jgi:photoactive yellow protein